MRLESAIICDAATVREGLVHILGGGVSVLSRAQFPATMGVSVAIGVRLIVEELAVEQSIGVAVNDVAGALVGSMETEIVVPREVNQPGGPPVIPLVVPIGMILLPAEGVYSVEISVNGKAQISLPFEARLLEVES